MNTIEVEIRGRLDDAIYNRLKAFLDENGKHIKSQEREMIMLRDYRGFVSNCLKSPDTLEIYDIPKRYHTGAI